MVTEPLPTFLSKTLTLPPICSVQPPNPDGLASLYSIVPSMPTTEPVGVGRMPTPRVPLILSGGGVRQSPNESRLRDTLGAIGRPFLLRSSVAPRFASWLPATPPKAPSRAWLPDGSRMTALPSQRSLPASLAHVMYGVPVPSNDGCGHGATDPGCAPAGT